MRFWPKWLVRMRWVSWLSRKVPVPVGGRIFRKGWKGVWGVGVSFLVDGWEAMAWWQKGKGWRWWWLDAVAGPYEELGRMKEEMRRFEEAYRLLRMKV